MNLLDSVVSTWTREECKQIIKACQDRLKDIAADDPVVYVIKRTSKRSGVRYRTNVVGMGWRQVLAKDLSHPSLWVASTRSCAQSVLDSYQKEHRYNREGMVHEIVELDKEEFKKLPCWENYKKYKSFGGSNA